MPLTCCDSYKLQVFFSSFEMNEPCGNRSGRPWTDAMFQDYAFLCPVKSKVQATRFHPDEGVTGLVEVHFLPARPRPDDAGWPPSQLSALGVHPVNKLQTINSTASFKNSSVKFVFTALTSINLIFIFEKLWRVNWIF
jgi:hypothetical protein